MSIAPVSKAGPAIARIACRPSLAHVALRPALTAAFSTRLTPSSRPTAPAVRPRFLSNMQSRNIFIKTESTPNQDSIKFLPGVPVMSQGFAEFLDVKAARYVSASTLIEKDNS